MSNWCLLSSVESLISFHSQVFIIKSLMGKTLAVLGFSLVIVRCF